ncbi:ATP-binding protein [Thermodesulfobacteriota bacterium]
MNSTSRKIIKMDQEEANNSRSLNSETALIPNNIKMHENLIDRVKVLEEKIESLKFFTYSISHDLKSPATSLYAITKRLQDKFKISVDEKSRAYCDQILRTAEQILSLVETINEYIVTRETPLNLTKIKVKEITESIRNEFSSRLKQHHIRWSEPEVMPEITADRMSLLRVFRNLTDNALKYGGKELLEISVGYEEYKDFYIFSFSDDGVGIKEDEEEKIFGAFQRNGTSSGISGSGLGLTIVKEAATRHQGKAWMVNNGRKGITFYISISKDLIPMD